VRIDRAEDERNESERERVSERVSARESEAAKKSERERKRCAKAKESKPDTHTYLVKAIHDLDLGYFCWDPNQKIEIHSQSQIRAIFLHCLRTIDTLVTLIDVCVCVSCYTH